MELHCRCFPGQSQRPAPVIYKGHSMVAVVTPWNTSSSEIEKIIQSFEELYNDLSLSHDHTRPFPILSSLSIEENNIHMACIHINRQWFNKNNKEELNSGFEAVFLLQKDSQIILAQVGNPQIYLSRKAFPLQWVGQSVSLNFYQQDPSPLPQTLMGIFKDISIGVYSIPKKDQDQIFLISRDHIPPLNMKKASLEQLGDFLIKDNPKIPFWLGQCDLSSS